MDSVKKRRLLQSVTGAGDEDADSSMFEVRLNAESFFNNPNHSDLTLEVNGGILTFYVHKVILSSRSEFFNKMFSGRNWKESYSQVVPLTIDTSFEEVFEDFLRFMYSGSVKLSKQTFWLMLFLADEYIVADLTSSCASYVKQNLKVARVQNHNKYSLDPMCTFSVTEVADIYLSFREENIKRSSASNLLARLDEIKEEEWLEFTPDVVAAILSGDACTTSELDLFGKATAWLQHDSSRKIHAEAILSCIRYCYINKIEDVFKIQMNEFVACSPKVVSHVAEGSHHKYLRNGLNAEDFGKIEEFSKKQYQNRRFYKKK